MAMEAWSGDWQQRLRTLVQRMGYEDVFAFVMAKKGESFGEMFGNIRRTVSADEAKILALRHLEELFYVDANERGQLRPAVMEALVRSLRQYLRKGWNCGKRVRERRIDARTRWVTPSLVAHHGWEYGDWRRFRELVWAEIESSGPSDDWCPQDHSDPVLQQVFSRLWPDPASG